MTKIIISLLALGLLLSNAQATNYCMAIRGNGELMPAHWGAISQVVQQKGIPSKLSGGSSASITIFLLESLAMNPRELNNTQKALLVKSFQGYFEALTQTEEGKALKTIIGDEILIRKLKEIASNIEKIDLGPETIAVFKRQLAPLQVLLNSKDLKDFINPEFVKYVKETAAMSSENRPELQAVILFRKNEITKAIQQFGKFNAVTDNTLFFRPGLVNFKSISRIIGQMGDFYAGVKLPNKKIQRSIDQDMSAFLAKCAPGSEKLTWQQINKQTPLCRQLLGRAVLTRRSAAHKMDVKSKRISQRVSQNLKTYPTTAILSGNAARSFRAKQKSYRFSANPNFGSDFKIAQSNLKFGYWGNGGELNRISSNLKNGLLTKNDEKSKKFLSLGDATWADVISISPAEPGLSNFIDVSEQYVSAGGWSDLHPTLVLKASGCEDIVYITRKGGESKFAQDVMERLTDIDGYDWSDWAGLSARQIVMKRSRGNARDVGPYASLWSKLYNMANPESSIQTSMKTATSTVCTNWDSFNAKKEINELVEEAFRAPWLEQTDQACNL